MSTITVTVLDAFGNPVSGATVKLQDSPSNGNQLTQPVGVTDANGVATGTLSSTVVGTKTITASVGGATITQTATVVVNPADASQLVFTTQPADVIIDQVISPAVVITALDPFRNVATGFAGEVQIAIAHDGSGLLGPATLGGTTTVPAVAGVATFSDLTLDRTGLLYTLAVSAGGVTGATSDLFNVVVLP